jgi:hypothetical protein
MYLQPTEDGFAVEPVAALAVELVAEPAVAAVASATPHTGEDL